MQKQPEDEAPANDCRTMQADMADEETKAKAMQDECPLETEQDVIDFLEKEVPSNICSIYAFCELQSLRVLACHDMPCRLRK